MTVFVLDNSVAMRWFFESGKHPYADAILRELTSGLSEALVPVLWRYEVCSVLARAELRGDIPAQEAADFIEDLAALPIQIDDEGAKRIFSDVRRLAIAHRLTSYDAAYLELAQRRSLPIATLDAELITACRSAGVRVL